MAEQKPGLLASSLVRFYHLLHGKLRLRGGGWLLRRAARVIPGLRDYPFPVPEVGTARLDFRDEGVFCLVNFCAGELGPDGPLIDAIEKVIQRGDVFWDIGANIVIWLNILHVHGMGWVESMRLNRVP
jgi:hypothetical protein